MSDIKCDIDFQKSGMQAGNLYIPCPRNESAWGVIPIPVWRFKNGEGPKVLFTAGAHGDEFEGVVALRKLINILDGQEFKGEISIIPSMNIPAMRKNQRLSPLDSRDLNRSFNHNLEGVTPSIAKAVMNLFISRADFVLDFHSGGNSLDFLPLVIMHQLQDKAKQKETYDAMLSFNAPYALILDEIDSQGMLDSYVEGLGKTFLTTELRGGGRVDKKGVEIALSGLLKLLCHLGCIDSTEKFNSHLLNHQTQTYNVPSEDCFVRSYDHGIFEPFFELGQSVKAGECVGQIHFFEEFDRAPVKLHSKVSGLVMATRPKGICSPGDALFMVALKY